MRKIWFVLLVSFCLLPLSQQAKPEEHGQDPGRRFDQEELNAYRQDRAFRYDVNPYRKTTVAQKISYYLSRLLHAIFREKGIAPILGSLILLLIIIFAAIKLSDGQFQWIFGRNSKGKTGAVILTGDTGETADFRMLADQALQAGEQRMYVRYRYLSMLKELNENAFIRLHKDKTNRDYLREIQNPEIRNQFRIQTLIFDYVWYGNFRLNNDQFQHIQSGFESLMRCVRDAKAKSDEG